MGTFVPPTVHLGYINGTFQYHKSANNDVANDIIGTNVF